MLAGRWTDGASGAHAGAREATSQAAHAQNSTHFDLLSKEVGTSEDSSSFEIKISSLFGDLLHLFFFTTKAFISVSTHFVAQKFSFEPLKELLGQFFSVDMTFLHLLCSKVFLSHFLRSS